MSLIDEALKRARQEAAQQDAARRGMAPAAPSWTPVPLSPRRERRSPVPIVVAVAVILLLAAGIAWWTRRTPAPRPETTVAARPAIYPVAAQPAAPAAQPSVKPAAPAPRDRADAAARSASRAESKAPGDLGARSERADVSERASHGDLADRADRDRTPPESRAARVEPPRAPRPEPDREPAAHRPARQDAPSSDQPSNPRLSQSSAAEPSAPRPPAAEARPAAPAPAEDGKSYVREAPLPGGRKLELRGIAFSGTQPVVLINGKVLSPGEGVEGYTVVAIEPQRVQMKGAAGTLYLTLQ